MVVEPGAGLGALIPDERFITAGAVLGDPWIADVLVTVTQPTGEQVRRLRRGALLIGFLTPLTAPETVARCGRPACTASRWRRCRGSRRAQSMDALSVAGNVAGYEAVLVARRAAHPLLPDAHDGCGHDAPAKVLVLGRRRRRPAGAGDGQRLGARTTGYDVRPEVAEQVQSLGAQLLDLGIEAAGEGGYARELTEEERDRSSSRR